MPINFPSTGLTANVSTYTLNDKTWLWNGTAWQLVSNQAGYTGSVGYTGSIGYSGSQGDRGDRGYLGSQGYTGSQGYDGSQGEIGYTGSKGVIGYSGSSGSLGYDGSQGETGYTGSKGVIGYTGSKGEQGYSGSIGYTGSKGVEGISSSIFPYLADLTSYSGSTYIGDGNIRWNNSTQITSTHLWVSHLTNPANGISYDIDVYLSLLDIGQIFVIQDANLSNNYQQWQISGTVTHQTSSTDSWWDIPVTLLDSGGSGTSNFSDNHQLFLGLISGATGYTGSQGSIGYTGSKGTIGYTGSKGDEGVIGYTGSQGPQGTIGYTGSQGTIGYTGSASTVIGYTGSQGSQGTIGYTGSQGTGTSWAAVQTSSFNAVAGTGYFVNTTSAAITSTLPASPTIGQSISFIDYAGTFDTNNLTVARNGGKIQGLSEDLTVSIERAAFTLLYVDSTQGWLLTTK